MWNQPYFNTPPNPLGGYILVPVGGPTTSGSSTTTTARPKSIRKALKQAQQDREAIDSYIKTLEEKKKGDKKPDDKKDEGRLSMIHMSMLLLMTAPFLGLLELMLLKMMASSLLK